MNRADFMKTMDDWDGRGRRVFTGSDMRKIFHEEDERTLGLSLRRMVDRENLEHPARGVYVNPRSRWPRTHLVEEVARALRRGHHMYVSLESALSEYGMISQIPVGYLTLMTTGRRGTFSTDYGVIEFTHTSRDPEDFLSGVRDVGRPLPLASPDRALRDLRRVGRNGHMLCPTDADDPGNDRTVPARRRARKDDEAAYAPVF